MCKLRVGALVVLMAFGMGLVADECRRVDLIRPREIDCADDTYVQGYLQGLIDLYFLEHEVNVCVDGCTVYLSNLPCNCAMRQSVIQFVRDFPGVRCVVIDDEGHCCRPVCRPSPVLDCCCLKGIWFPDRTMLYLPMLADPRRIHAGLTYRFNDRVFGGPVGVATFGDRLPVYRWNNVGPWCGKMQIGIEGGAWAVFKFESGRLMEDDDSIALQNTDFWFAIPLTYAVGCWSYRFRLYHTSTHLGDEFMVMHPEVKRLNPSREAVDFFASYQLTPQIRVYGGVGWNMRSNYTFRVDPFYLEYGFEVHIFSGRDCCRGTYLDPYFAAFFRNWQDFCWKFDATYVLGLEWAKFRGVGRKLRLYLEYHDGFSVEGQFAKFRTEYFAIALSWGW